MRLSVPALPHLFSRLVAVTAVAATIAPLSGAGALPVQSRAAQVTSTAGQPGTTAGTATQSDGGTSTPTSATPVSPASTAQGTDAIPPIVADAFRKASAAIAASDPGCRLTWPVLAGIGQVESGQANNGQVTADGTTIHPILGPALNGQAYAAVKASDGSWAHSVGPMQFTTWDNPWPNWRSGNPDDLRSHLDWPTRGAVASVQHGYWHSSWGDRPDDIETARSVA